VTGHRIATIKVRVRIGDINYGNHVGNDAFVAIIHEARMQWLQGYGYTELDIEGMGLIMSDLSLEFKNECYYGEEIEITIYASDVGRVNFDLYYSLNTSRKGVDVLLANAKTGMVSYDYNQKKVAQVPEGLKKILVP
jgi:acyl-CoA thioesterase FadM